MAVVLLGLSVSALALALDRVTRAPIPRPPSTGEVGEVTVYVQTVEGPYPLTAGRTSVLPRPQSVAFQVSAVGSGPRLVRVDLEDANTRRTLYEGRFMAPFSSYSLPFVARFGETAADHLVVTVAVEAPHLPPVIRRYPLELVTAAHRFWAGERRPAAK